MKLLISAFGCAPGYGSEVGNGWNWSSSLADAGHEVTVLTVPLFKEAVERGLAERSDARLRVVYVPIPQGAKRIPGQVGVYAQYLAWQWAAYRVAKLHLRQRSFDVLHHVSWGSLQLGTWMGRLPIPLVFGPVGGGQIAPRELRAFYAGDWRTEAIRTFVTTKLMLVDPFARMTTGRARVVLVNNGETADLARKLGASDVRYASELGLPVGSIVEHVPEAVEGPLRLLWVGRLMPRKGLPLALRATAEAASRTPVRLTILGAGPQSGDVLRWAGELGITDIVDFRGHVSFDEVQSEYQRNDLMLFTSLRDSSGAQLLESMAAGLPIVALDQSGAAQLIGPDRGLLVLADGVEDTVQRWADAIERFAREPELRTRMSHASLEYARSQQWPAKVAEMTAIYKSIVGVPKPPRKRGTRVTRRARVARVENAGWGWHKTARQ